MKRIPRIPRPTLGDYKRPSKQDLVSQAAEKNPRISGPAGSTRTKGPHHPQGWKTPPRQLKPKDRVKTADNPNPPGFAPTGKHRGRGQAKDTGYEGRRRAYEGRHRPYEAKHRREDR